MQLPPRRFDCPSPSTAVAAGYSRRKVPPSRRFWKWPEAGSAFLRVQDGSSKHLIILDCSSISGLPAVSSHHHVEVYICCRYYTSSSPASLTTQSHATFSTTNTPHHQSLQTSSIFFIKKHVSPLPKIRLHARALRPRPPSRRRTAL
jgi:hypothetical protein